MVKIAIVGMGVRGTIYANELMKQKGRAAITAICDIREERLQAAAKEFQLPPDACFSSDADFFAQGKLADGVIICSDDRFHYRQTLHALRLGYEVLLEKPASADPGECSALIEAARQAGRGVYLCHVLRYSVFAQQVKRILHSGVLGTLVGISLMEHIGYYHYIHSYVRGTWRREEDSGPLVLTKCCHDLDLLSYFVESPAMQVSSLGGQRAFTAAGRPKGAAAFCRLCQVREDCPFDSIAFYQNNHEWLGRAGAQFDFTDNAIEQWLSNPSNPYGRCVYACDNTVADHQNVRLLFQNGVQAELTLSAFTANEGRSMVFFGTKGELRGDLGGNILSLHPFGQPERAIRLKNLPHAMEHHGGGDALLTEDFLLCLEHNPQAQRLTELSRSLESHRIAFAAELSRRTGSIPVPVSYN